MAPSSKNVHDAHISKQIRTLHESLIQIVSFMNRPDNDKKMVERAGITLDHALFPLLVGVERLGPIGVVELAARAGRDYTTVSRQVAKLESLGLVQRKEGSRDKRVNEAHITKEGRAMIDRIDAAREKVGKEIFESWELNEIDDFILLTKKFVDGVNDSLKKSKESED